MLTRQHCNGPGRATAESHPDACIAPSLSLEDCRTASALPSTATTTTSGYDSQPMTPRPPDTDDDDDNTGDEAIICALIIRRLPPELDGLSDVGSEDLNGTLDIDEADAVYKRLDEQIKAAKRLSHAPRSVPATSSPATAPTQAQVSSARTPVKRHAPRSVPATPSPATAPTQTQVSSARTPVKCHAPRSVPATPSPATAPTQAQVSSARTPVKRRADEQASPSAAKKKSSPSTITVSHQQEEQFRSMLFTQHILRQLPAEAISSDDGNVRNAALQEVLDAFRLEPRDAAAQQCLDCGYVDQSGALTPFGHQAAIKCSQGFRSGRHKRREHSSANDAFDKAESCDALLERCKSLSRTAIRRINIMLQNKSVPCHFSELAKKIKAGSHLVCYNWHRDAMCD